MRLSLFLVFFPFIIPATAQNLIENGSFENGECPRSYSKKPNHFSVAGWFAPDKSTPDYYHRCAYKDVTIPSNWAGNQNPVDGDAYVGIYLKKGSRYQENLGIELVRPLKKDGIYEISFSLANTANTEFLACEISILITANPIYPELTSLFDYRQIVLEIPAPVDYLDFGWYELSFTYTAKGGERFFYIGSLNNPTKHCRKNIFRIQIEPMLKNASYVYLDDIQFEVLSEPSKEGTLIEPEEPQFSLISELRPISINFDFDTYYLNSESVKPLDTLNDFVIKNNLYLLVTGSTDSLGTKQYNMDLGQKRADTVKDYLSFSGIEQSRITAVSKGEETPNYSNHSEEYRRLNRNVLIEFFRKN